ncbi:MAG TPA: cupin [Burkholderiales bacterium]
MTTTAIDTTAFEAELRRDGYDDIVLREIPPQTVVKDHSHDFDVRALMLAGDFTLGCNGTATTYRPGEVFTMAAGRKHDEAIGAQGASYLVGRRHAKR